MSFNVKRQLLGAAGAGGGPAYFFSVIEPGTDGGSGNCAHVRVDSSDNIFVDFDYYDNPNYNLGLVKYDTGGNVLAQNEISGVQRRPATPADLGGFNWASAIDGSGNFKVVSNSGSDKIAFLTINPSTLATSSSYEKKFSSGSTYSGFMDTSGNGYLLGRDGSGGTMNIAKFNSSGSQQFSKGYAFYTPFGANWAFPYGGGVDSSGNVYIGGSHPFFGYEGIITKLNSSGTHQWTRNRYVSGRNNAYQRIGFDSSGNAYAVGYISENTGGSEISYIAKFNSSGTFQWDHVLEYDNQKGCFQDIAFDSSGNIYLAGSFQEDPIGNFAGSYRWFGVFAKLNSSGTLQWQRGLGYTSAVQNDNDMFSSIAIDSNDDMVLCSVQDNTSASGDPCRVYVARLPNDGSLTGSYNQVDAKYESTNFSDQSIGDTRNATLNSSNNQSISSSTFGGSDNSVTYTINTETA